MALSRIVAIGNGSATQFAIPFALGFIKRSDVTCQVGAEQDGSGNPIYRPMTWISDELVDIAGTGPVPGVGVRVTFTRTVDRGELIVDYEDGDILNEENMNTAQKQALMLVHEVLDGRFEQFQANFDLGGFQIKNLGEPTVGTDAATKNYADSRIADGAANAAAAAASAAAASGFASTASTAAQNSINAAAASVEARNTSQAAAAATAGSVSAAATSASNAATSASQADGHRGAAATSATNAATSASQASGSATAAETSATNAANSATASDTARAASVTAKDTAVAAKDAAVTANGIAQTAATTATTKAGEASTSAANALASENKVATAAVPVGMVFFSPKGTVPNGYFALEGGSFDQTVHTELFAYLGTNVLPDYRDRVLRGAGTLAGAVGTMQEDAIQQHRHAWTNGAVPGQSGARWTAGTHGGWETAGGQDQYNQVGDVTGARTATETRVKAAIGKFVIKAFGAVADSGTANLIAIVNAQQWMVRFDAQVLSQAQRRQVIDNLKLGFELIADDTLTGSNTATNWSITNLSDYDCVSLQTTLTRSAPDYVYCRIASDNGAGAWRTSQYENRLFFATANTPGQVQTQAEFNTSGINSHSSGFQTFNVDFWNFGLPVITTFQAKMWGYSPPDGSIYRLDRDGTHQASEAMNAIQLVPAVGVFNPGSRFRVWGKRK